MLFLRSLIYFLIMVSSAILFAPIALLTYPFPFATRYRIISQWARFNLWSLGLICKLYFEVEGRENITTDSAIIFCKHQSTWETFALQMIFPPQVWVLKRELLRVPFFGWGLAMLEPVAIDRASGRKALKQLTEQGIARLKHGRWVVIFPEGTRMPKGQRRRFGFGGGMLAQKSGYPVSPVAHNAGDFWPRRSFIKHPGTIRVAIGTAIESEGRKAGEINELAETWIAAKMAEFNGLPEAVVERQKRSSTSSS